MSPASHRPRLPPIPVSGMRTYPRSSRSRAMARSAASHMRGRMGEGRRNEPNVIAQGKVPRPSSPVPVTRSLPFFRPAGRAGTLRYPCFPRSTPWLSRVAFPVCPRRRSDVLGHAKKQNEIWLGSRSRSTNEAHGKREQRAPPPPTTRIPSTPGWAIPSYICHASVSSYFY